MSVYDLFVFDAIEPKSFVVSIMYISELKLIAVSKLIIKYYIKTRH